MRPSTFHPAMWALLDYHFRVLVAQQPEARLGMSIYTLRNLWAQARRLAKIEWDLCNARAAFCPSALLARLEEPRRMLRSRPAGYGSDRWNSCA